MNRRRFLALFALAPGLAACTTSKTPTTTTTTMTPTSNFPTPTHTPEPPEPPMTLADDALSGDFTPIDGDQSDLMTIGFSLLGSPNTTAGSDNLPVKPNTVVSPVGAAAAAGVIAEGAANGTTKIDPKQLQPAWTMWHPWAGPPAATPQDIPVIAAVARLLAAPEVPIKPAYRDTIAGWDVPIETGAITQENLDGWVNKSTAGLVNKSGIDVTRGDINFVLQNAITFAARWRERFNANKTRQSRFTKTTGETIMVDMMWLSRTTAPYTVSDGWRGVRLDYTDGELAVFVLIPDADPGQVTPTMLKQAVSQLCRPNETTGLVRVGLPKLRLTTKKDLIPFLQYLGLAGTIDLPTMTNANPIDITQAVQQAIMLVDEEGTVASAVTEVGGLVGAAPGTIPEQPIDIIADRPFYLVIGDVVTGTPLFLSRISDPAA